jgi:hypothetical protein
MKRLLVAFMLALGLLTAVPGCVVYDYDEPGAVYAEAPPADAVYVGPYTYYTVTVVDGVAYRHYWRWHAGYGWHYHGRMRAR